MKKDRLLWTLAIGLLGLLGFSSCSPKLRPRRPVPGIPDSVRVSFSDGTTAIYDLHTDQPAPVIYENIRIIRKMKVGYQAATKHQYRPRRRNKT